MLYRPELVRNKIGVLGMKSLANGIILRSKTVTATECLHYALSLPTSVVITGIDSVKILKQAVDAVDSFQPLSKPQLQRLLKKTANAAAQGAYELFKTSSIFDATANNPEWLGDEPERRTKLMPA